MGHNYYIPYKAVFVALMLILLMAGCRGEKPPIRLGFIAGMSGRNADMGQAGRNGAMLAVEEANRTGGINGRLLELVIRDDANEAKIAMAAVREIVNQNVTAIVGPFTTPMCEAVRTITEPEKMLVFSPTSAGAHLAGKDDYFFRLITTTERAGKLYARFMVEKRKIKRVSMMIDSKNKSYTQSWTDAFKKEARTMGCEIVAEKWEDLGDFVFFESLIHQLLEPAPDAVLLAANAMNVARFAQQFRKVDPKTEMFATGWAGTRQLIELGGKAVDGMVLYQVFDIFSKKETYLRFVKAYEGRFKTLPDYPGICAYETVQILIKAMKNRKKGQSLKQSILANNPYQGLNQTLMIDRYGDTQRKFFFVVVKGLDFTPVSQ